MNISYLLLIAVTPSFLLMAFIYWMDRHRPEALKHVLIAMVLGGAATIPAIVIQMVFSSAPFFDKTGVEGSFRSAFFLAAPSEELLKFAFIYLYVRNKSFFNEQNDGMVYYGIGALGFATIENILYVLGRGFSTGMLRAFTSIPLHAFCGIIIGYYAGIARFSPDKKFKIYAKGLLLAYLTHALYNTMVLSESMLFLLPLLLLLVFIYVYGYRLLKQGRNLSLNTPLAPPVEPKASRKPAKRHKWKVWVSRPLLLYIISMWVLVFWPNDSDAADILNMLIGMIVLSLIPFLLVVMLEISYRRSNRKSTDTHMMHSNG